MKNFGIYKSKVEKLLIESYSNNTIKNNFVMFRDLILNDKNMVKMFYLYDQLSSNKNMSKDIAKEYIEECIQKIKETNVSKEKISLIENWTKNITTENNYKNIDNLLEDDVLKIESKLESKKVILETISKKEVNETKEIINIPLKTSINIANQKLVEFISNLNENEKTEFLEIAKMEDKNLNENYQTLKQDTLGKLNSILENESDFEVKTKIQETMNKISVETPDKLTYYKLKKLNETI